MDRERIRNLHTEELARFRRARSNTIALLERARKHMPNGTPMAWMAYDNDLPVYVARGEGPGFTDVDGFTYVDFNASDMAMFCGHANPAIVRAVTERVSGSTQFLLPTEESVWVAEELARRYPVGHWQFTLSASQANTEAIRVARAATGRETVLLFEGHYHGHFDEALIDIVDGANAPIQRGLTKSVTGKVRIARFNDVEGMRSALEPRDVAIVLTEPAMTNNLHMLLPEPGWHTALREATRETGTVLAYDETHTHVVGERGCTGLWQLDPDIVTLGKSIAGGVPMGAYGMIESLAREIDVPGEVASGGTLFGNPLSAAAAKAALGEVLVPEAYQHAASLATRLEEGINAAIRSAGLAWTTYRLGPRAGQWYGPKPGTSDQALALTDMELTRLLRIWMANRGVWEALPGAGPTVPIPALEKDADLYVNAYGELLAELAR
jgi:glutamate-1-semialdehyde 2,1-aminomutase